MYICIERERERERESRASVDAKGAGAQEGKDLLRTRLGC